MKALIARLKKDERGTTAIEYALIAGIVSVSILVALQLLLNGLDSTYAGVTNSLPR